MAVKELVAKYPDDTGVQFNCLPTVRAKLVLNQGNIGRAIEELDSAAPYEMGFPGHSSYIWTALYPVYVRGEVYLAAHEGDKEQSNSRNFWTIEGLLTTSRLALSRIWELHVRTRYKAIQRRPAQPVKTPHRLEERRPDIPILKQAKAEYAKLQ